MPCLAERTSLLSLETENRIWFQMVLICSSLKISVIQPFSMALDVQMCCMVIRVCNESGHIGVFRSLSCCTCVGRDANFDSACTFPFQPRILPAIHLSLHASFLI